MKRLALFILLAALPAVAFGSQHYIVVTTHPFDEAVQRLPREDFDPAVRAAMRVRPFQVINGFDAELSDDQVKRMLASAWLYNEDIHERQGQKQNQSRCKSVVCGRSSRLLN